MRAITLGDLLAQADEDVPLTARIDEDEVNPELVFCAHCRGHSVSTRYFVGELGRDLLAAIASPVVPQ